MVGPGHDLTVLIAPDSFKGSFSAPLVAEALARGCEDAGVRADRCPVADGGEGTAEVLRSALGGDRVPVPAHDPLGRPIEAEVVLLADGSRAVVEVAAASGLTLLDPDDLDPWQATSRGTGELIRAAAELGAREVLVAAGGSATVDGGRGAIEALSEGLGLGELSLTVLCDVDVPWESCAEVFGPQKGADPALVEKLALRLDEVATSLPRDPRRMPMGGAAGGLSGGLWAVCDATLVMGAPFVFEAVEFDRRLGAAACAITGEGRLDDQSAMGKIVGQLAARAAAAAVPLHAVVGADARQGSILDGLASVTEAETLEAIEAAGRQIALTGAEAEL